MSIALKQEAARVKEALEAMARDMERPAEDAPAEEMDAFLERYAATLRTLADRLAAVLPPPDVAES